MTGQWNVAGVADALHGVQDGEQPAAILFRLKFGIGAGGVSRGTFREWQGESFDFGVHLSFASESIFGEDNGSVGAAA